jgi:hypothetical protein
VPLHGALTPLVHLQAKEALNSQFRQRTQVTREGVGLKRLDTPALAEGAGLWGDVPWRLATGNERLTGLLVGNRIDHLWVCGGKWESYGGGGKGWWGWEADIPLATAEGRARVCSSEHSNEPLGRTVLLHQGGTGFQRVLHSPNPIPQRELWVLDHPAPSQTGRLQTLP